jgi:hypothetical protein
LAVARQEARARPPIAAPSALGPFLRFQKQLPTNALVPVRRAVESDHTFRGRVAAIATEDIVGRAGWLWLTRPGGWEAELDRLAIDAAAELESGEAARAERDARKRLDAAELAARNARAEAAVATTALGTERARREDTEASLARTKRRLDQVEIELGGARRRLEQALVDKDEAQDATAAVLAELTAARAELAETEHRLDAARQAGTEALAELALRHGPGVLAVPAAVEPTGPPPSPSRTTPELTAAAAALREAAQATARLGDALAAAAESLGASGRDALSDVGPPRSPRRLSRGPHKRRAPLRLPGGLFDDSAEAAEHLVRAPGVLLVVDGYNVAKLGWPALTLAEQRVRLLDALDEMGARFGTDVHVVFDGADMEPVPLGRRHLRVDFSPPGVTADDVIVDMVGHLPADRAVVVATNDGDVRRRSRAGGANVVSSEQLLAIARRC